MNSTSIKKIKKKNIHNSLTWNSPNMEATKIPAKKRMDKQTTVLSYSGMPSLTKRSRNSVCFKERLPCSCWAAVLWVRALLWTPIMVMMSLTSKTLLAKCLIHLFTQQVFTESLSCASLVLRPTDGHFCKVCRFLLNC